MVNSLSIPEKLTEELAEETGLHVGDGTMNFYKYGNKSKGSYSLRGHIIDDKEHYDKIISNLYREIYNLKISLREMPSTGVYGFQKWSDELVLFKHKVLGLSLGKKLDIKIPKQFYNNDFCIHVIRGIFDTDGMLYLQPKYGKLYPRIEISTISEVLALQLHKILNNKGIRTTVYSSQRNIKLSEIYRISVRGNEMLQRWMKIIEPHNPKHLAKYQYFLNKN